MHQASIVVLAVGLSCVALGQKQPNLYHPSKASIKELMKKAAAEKSSRANTIIDFAKPKQDHRNRESGIYERRGKPCPFETLIPVPVDTNYALHGADYAVGYGWPVQYDDASASPTQGVLIVNNCSAHAYVAHVNLFTIQYNGRWRDCTTRPRPCLSLNP